MKLPIGGVERVDFETLEQKIMDEVQAKAEVQRQKMIIKGRIDQENTRMMTEMMYNMNRVQMYGLDEQEQIDLYSQQQVQQQQVQQVNVTNNPKCEHVKIEEEAINCDICNHHCQHVKIEKNNCNHHCQTMKEISPCKCVQCNHCQPVEVVKSEIRVENNDCECPLKGAKQSFIKGKEKLMVALVVVIMLILAIGITPGGAWFEAIQTSYVELLVDFFRVGLLGTGGFLIYKLLKNSKER